MISRALTRPLLDELDESTDGSQKPGTGNPWSVHWYTLDAPDDVLTWNINVKDKDAEKRLSNTYHRVMCFPSSTRRK